MHGQAFSLTTFGVDQDQLVLIGAIQKIAYQNIANAALTRTGANDGNSLWGEKDV